MSRTSNIARPAAALTAAALICAPAALLPAQAAEDAKVSVLHAVPDAAVDVWVNGKPLLKNFKPSTLTDELSLPAGDYDLKIVKTGDPADATAIVEANDVTVPAGANITVVAHLNDAGKPTLTPFMNDTKKIAAGQARLTVRHVAKAPSVDIRANGDVAFAKVTNPNSATADLPAGKINADVVLAGTDTVALGPADLNLKEGSNTIVYAWGDADKKLNLATQTLHGMHSHPGHVPSGTGGQAVQSTTGTHPGQLAFGYGTAGLSILAAGLLVARNRRRVSTK